MKYYQNVFNLLHIDLKIGTQGFPNLPPSVNEWYSFENGFNLLLEYSNQDHPLHPEGFKVTRYQNHNLSIFMYENQYVVWWAFEGDKSDDPPVYVNIDPDYNEWVLCCDAFSTFIFTRLFDFRSWGDKDLKIAGSGYPLESETLIKLRKDFIERPITYGFPGDVQYRFSKNDQRILIWISPEQTDWNFTADTISSVLNVYEKFKHLLVWNTDLPGS